MRAPDVPYVPTPEDVVSEMLRLAAVTTQDVVYDLGSGDGRIVIAAARDFGARGVGLEIDPLLVEASRKNASVAGVSHRVEFVHADLFQADLRRATVVTFYLLPSVAEALRPKLLRELAPGTRVVSHNYGMGDWEPLKSVQVDERHVVHLWVVEEKTSGFFPLPMGEGQGEGRTGAAAPKDKVGGGKIPPHPALSRRERGKLEKENQSQSKKHAVNREGVDAARRDEADHPADRRVSDRAGHSGPREVFREVGAREKGRACLAPG